MSHPDECSTSMPPRSIEQRLDYLESWQRTLLKQENQNARRIWDLRGNLYVVSGLLVAYGVILLWVTR